MPPSLSLSTATVLPVQPSTQPTASTPAGPPRQDASLAEQRRLQLAEIATHAGRVARAIDASRPAEQLQTSAPANTAPATQAAPTDYARTIQAMYRQFPDIRRHAKAAIEAQILDYYHLRIDADQVYYNQFDLTRQGEPPLMALGGGKFEGRRPDTSRSLTDMLIAVAASKRAPVADSDRIADAGLHTEGTWSSSFGDHNKVPLTAAQFLHAAQQTHFIDIYRQALRQYWTDNLDTLQTLAEAQVVDYMETHRRAGNRAHALGLDDDADLSDIALSMIATATGRHDPDLPAQRVDILRFDINGYVSRDIVWLRNAQGRIVLLVPGDTRPVREYRDLAQMREGIRDMLRNKEGRKALAARFNDADRPTSWYSLYDGIDRWLETISRDQAGAFDHAIASAQWRYDGAPLVIGSPGPEDRTLLSNKALAMLTEAAGQVVDEPLRRAGAKPYLFDINGTPAADMLWLQSDDKHVVLIMPGNVQPIREYKNLEAMRDDILAMLDTTAGRAELASHFSPVHLDGSGGEIDRWLADLAAAPARYRQRIAYDPQRNSLTGKSSNVFFSLVSRQRELQLAQLDALAGKTGIDIGTATRKEEWISAFDLARQPFYSASQMHRVCDGALAETHDTSPQPAPRLPRSPDMPDTPRPDFIDLCMRSTQRAANWGRRLADRLRIALDRVAHRERQAADNPAMPGSSSGRVAVPPPAAFAQGRRPNAHGFLEYRQFDRLYVVINVSTVRSLAERWRHYDRYYNIPMPTQADRLLPETHGIPRQATFAAGRRALEGPVIDAWLTPEAARRAAEIRYGESARHAALYEIDARLLTGVMFADNRLHNPDYARLMSDRPGSYQNHVAVGGFVTYPYGDSPYVAITDSMVQLRFGQGMQTRLQRIPD